MTDFELKIEKLKNLIEQSNKIVFFGGAGVSTESNIPDFRSADGLYRQTNKGKEYSPEEILSAHFFKQNAKCFYDFYREKMLYPDAKPNITHKKLAELEKRGKLLGIITQNIDGLHQKAGSKNVAELHGTSLLNHCTNKRCKKEFDLEYILNYNRDSEPRCDECGSIIKPDITLYEEMLPKDAWNKAYNWINEADLLIVGGTSLSVYPAASLIYDYQGNSIVIINKDCIKLNHLTENDLVFDCSLGEVFKHL